MKKREPAGEGRDRRRKIRPLAAILLAAALVVTAVQIPGVAAKAKPLDLTQKCSLTVVPSGDESYKEDLYLHGNMVIDLYKVADVNKVSGYDSYTYTVNQGYSDNETLNDYLAEENLGSLTTDRWLELAQEAAKTAMGDETAGDGLPVTNTVEDIRKAASLDAGLYLIVARSKDAEPGTYLMKDAKPAEGTQEQEPQAAGRIATEIQTDQYVYTFQPELISLPNRENDEGVANTANPIDWQYVVTATLKPEREYRKTDLTIVKTLAGQSLMAEPATFVFRVEAWLDTDNDGEDEKVYSNVAGVTFTSGSQEVTLADAIPAGARVVVTEVYTGASYEVSGAGASVNLGPASAEEVLRAEFTNTPSDRHRGGHGIVNSFTYGAGTWTWSADPAQPGTE